MSNRTPPIPVVAGINDPMLEGIADGWKVHDAADLADGTLLDADVIIIGTGAGGGTSAEVLAEAGFRVLMLEEGPLRTTNDFKMDEREAYRDMYQESAGRMTKNGAMSVLQGRCVGGSTAINWTSSFRTPAETLTFWGENYGVKGFAPEDMTPWFERMEERLNIHHWPVPPNANNAVLRDGAEKVGIEWKSIPRNVSSCWNLGYCGTGCPTNAKQSMLVTTIPGALKHQSELVYSARAEKLLLEGNKVAGVEITALGADKNPTGSKLVARAPHVVMACGGINGPALLLRSKVPDPKKRVGKRTFLHPVAFNFAKFDKTIDPYYGAPQTIYSDEYQWKSVDGPVGYKLEVPPLQPGLAAVLMLGHGGEHFEALQDLPNTHSMMALMRDGFNPESSGGEIELSSDGSPIINYEMNEYLWEGFQRAFLKMAELEFAAGAKAVRVSHLDSRWYTSLEEAQQHIPTLEFRANAFTAGSAHVMGGLCMGEDLETCVVNSEGKYHYLDNLWVFDGSTFPTSIGANPQLSVYGLACKQANGLVKTMRAEKAAAKSA
ncbi:GMC family oxidoreductase N-terminal domain-containing protein [Bacterioplanoides sp.]|uniref:GMC family oxidoreductase n=1 Tax=Bacterioplanoides sp. TaxID=2066072 RepID=UPI003B00B424